MIPLFPQFKRLAFEDKVELQSYTRKFPPYSDYNFTSLWCWDKEQTVSLSMLNDNLVVEFRDYVTNDPFLSFIGVNKVIETIELLLRLVKNKNLSPILKLIPEVTVLSNTEVAKIFNIKEDRDNFDYVYSIPETIEFRGNKYRPKRNFVNRFTRLYKSHHNIINLKDIAIQKLFSGLLEVWRKQKEADPLDIENEFAAIKRLINSIHYLELLSIGLFINDRLIGFSVNEIEPQGYATNLFEKADIKYAGAYQYLRSIAASYLSEKGCQLLNHEQDLGIPGLRKSKLSYKPKFFLKKYTVSTSTV